MNIPLITWSVTLALVVLLIVCRFISACRFCNKGHHKIVEFGSEREEFFLPGDRIISDDEDYEEFDDI